MRTPGKINNYILASSLAAILTVTLFGWYSVNQFQANEVKEEHEKLETCIRTFWQLLSNKGTNFRIVDGKLLAGTYPVNGNFELPDKVQELFGGVATIFMEDERVSTNVLNAEGKRALGTKLLGPAYDAVFKQGKPYRGVANILGVPYHTAYDPIRGPKGKVIGVLFVGAKESEFLAKLSELRMNLALALFSAVSIFTIFMIILGRAMKLAEEEKSRLEAQLNQALMMEKLMVRLGHDLKTPLTPLCILLPLVRGRITDPSVNKMLDICIKNATSIKELTDKTRMLANFSLDVLPSELGSIQISSVVDECFAASADALACKAVHCRNEIDPAIVVQVVPAQIQELFTNLISNALRYSSENGIIRVTAEQNAEAVTISVADNGIGLAPVYLERIFEEFFKVDESRHDLNTSGLGLSICRRIVRNHHGSIWAESAGLGHGTSIMFTLNEIQHGGKEAAANG